MSTSWWLYALKNNRENIWKCFWTKENETQDKFNPELSSDRPSNNWALDFIGSEPWTHLNFTKSIVFWKACNEGTAVYCLQITGKEKGVAPTIMFEQSLLFPSSLSTNVLETKSLTNYSNKNALWANMAFTTKENFLICLQLLWFCNFCFVCFDTKEASFQLGLK